MLAAVGYSAITDETILILEKDRPGALAPLSRAISDLGVEIRSLSLINIREADDVVVVSTSNNEKVREHFREQLLN